MCICTSLSCLILYNTSWVSYGAVFHVSTIHYHVVSCAILVSHVMYIILIIYLTMFFNFQGLFWIHYLHISIHMYVQLPHYIKCKCLVWCSLQCNEMINSVVTISPFSYTVVRHYTDYFDIFCTHHVTS